MHVSALTLPVDNLPLPEGAATEGTLSSLLKMLMYPVYLDRAQNRTRGTVNIESGTVTTVGTVSNVSQVDGLQGRLQIMNNNTNAWANVVRRTIS